MLSYTQKERELNMKFNEIELIGLYQHSKETVLRIQILSRLKKVLLKIPNQIQADPGYLKQCNDKYYFLIINQINENLNKEKPQSMRFLFHVISLRIKTWFNKKQFDDIFSSFMINIQHNKKMIPYVVEFLIQLIDTFQSSNLNKNQYLQNKQHIQCQGNSSSRFTLTRKTNNHLFSDAIPNRKTYRATKQLNKAFRNKDSYTKQNRFQREFLDFQLNKILIFANQLFNRAIIQNSDYNYDEECEGQQQEQLFYIKMPISHITKDLELIHRILTYDFFGDKKNNDQDWFFDQKKPLIIPTKYSKLCQFHQFENWIKNKAEFYKYQYLYFYTNQPELKIIIVRILGDLLRIHQKFFKKQVLFKNHIQNVISPLKSMLQNHQIRYNQEYQLAIVFGQNINKLLSNSVFPTFLNLIKNQFKSELMDTLDVFIHKQILQRCLLDVTLIKLFLGFLVQLLQKLSVNSSSNFRIIEFKQEVQIAVRRTGDAYEDLLYLFDSQCQIQEQFLNMFLFRQSLHTLNLQHFQAFFQFFKFYAPKRPYREDLAITQKCIFICSKIQHNLFQYEIQMRSQQKDDHQHTKTQLLRRYSIQSFSRLLQILTINTGSTQTCNSTYKLKILVTGFFFNKLFSCKLSNLLIFDENNFIFDFTSKVIQLVFQIKSLQPKNQLENGVLNDMKLHCMQMFQLLTKLNREILNARKKQLDVKNQVNQIESRVISIRRDSFLFRQISSCEANRQNQIKSQCQNGAKQLSFFQEIIQQIKAIFVEQGQEEQTQTATTIKKGLVMTIKQKEFQEILQPIYSLYFISLQKYQLHQNMHLQYYKYRKKPLQDSFINQEVNQDQCSVLQEEQDTSQNKSLPKCCQDTFKHDYNHSMNPISYLAFLSHLNLNEGLKATFQNNFQAWFKCQHKGQSVTKQKGCSLMQVYDVQTVLKRLVNEYFPLSSDTQNHFLKQFRYYLLKCSSILLKMFRISKFDLQIKRQILSSTFSFISNQFKTIIQRNYELELEDQNFQEDKLMAGRVQAQIHLLQNLVNVHYYQHKINIFNEQFYLLFPNQDKQGLKAVDINRDQRDQALRPFLKSKETCILFGHVLRFLLDFPEQYIAGGYYPLIESQLIKLVKQVYFQFSQFMTIYILNLQGQDCPVQVIQRIQLCEVTLEQGLGHSLKYAMIVSERNLLFIVKGYVLLVEYIQKVIRMSIVSANQQWLSIRNKQCLPFIRQAVCVMVKLQNQPDLLKLAFGMRSNPHSEEEIDENRLTCVLRAVYESIFQFLEYFLTNFQDHDIYFITKHLSFIEHIYQFIDIGLTMQVDRMNQCLQNHIQSLNSIVIFKAIPQLDQSGRKPSARKNKQEHKIIKYKGWQYVQRLYTQDEESILQELEAYQINFKYYITDKKVNLSVYGGNQKQAISEELQITQYRQNEEIESKINKSIIQSMRKMRENSDRNSWADIQQEWFDQYFMVLKGQIFTQSKTNNHLQEFQVMNKQMNFQNTYQHCQHAQQTGQNIQYDKKVSLSLQQLNEGGFTCRCTQRGSVVQGQQGQIVQTNPIQLANDMTGCQLAVVDALEPQTQEVELTAASPKKGSDQHLSTTHKKSESTRQRHSPCQRDRQKEPQSNTDKVAQQDVQI